jgi:hypothetical protein
VRTSSCAAAAGSVRSMVTIRRAVRVPGQHHAPVANKELAMSRGLALKLFAVAALCGVLPRADATSRAFTVQQQVHMNYDASSQRPDFAPQLRTSSAEDAAGAGAATTPEPLAQGSQTRLRLDRIPSVDQMGCAWIPISTSRRKESPNEGTPK